MPYPTQAMKTRIISWLENGVWVRTFAPFRDEATEG